MRASNVLISILICIAYLGVQQFMFFSGMAREHDMPGCPFMLGEEAICQMNELEHISAWQNTFTTILPLLFSFSIVASIFFVAWFYWYPPPSLVERLLLSVRRRNVFVIPLHQALYSRGILHAKIP